MFEVNPDDLKKAIEALKVQRQTLEKLIRPFLSSNLTYKQTLEVCQVGKFLTLLNLPSQIVIHDDSPDFIISVNGEKIGLEHERILNRKKVAAIKSVEKLFNDAAEVFKVKYPGHNLLANCWLNTDNFTFKKSDTEKLKDEIANYIFGLYAGTCTLEKPSYIDRVYLMKHSQVSFCYNPGGHVVSNLDKRSLESAILKKEPLVEKYKVKSGLSKQWLLIVIGAVTPDSYEYGDNQFKVDISSSFDSVFLMEDFNAHAWQIL
jgi:hypothetical protein